jgi:hypothetical protein
LGCARRQGAVIGDGHNQPALKVGGEGQRSRTVARGQCKLRHFEPVSES